MRAIAKWLRCAFPTGTPPIFVTLLNLDFAWFNLRHYRFGHKFSFRTGALSMRHELTILVDPFRFLKTQYVAINLNY